MTPAYTAYCPGRACSFGQAYRVLHILGMLLPVADDNKSVFFCSTYDRKRARRRCKKI
jgi:hypothetical protein